MRLAAGFVGLLGSVLLAGCAGGPASAVSVDPFADGDGEGEAGKDDRAAAFFGPDRGYVVSIEGRGAHRTVVVSDDRRSVRYRGAEVERLEAGREVAYHVRLDADERLAGMRAFELRPLGGGALDRVRRARLLEALGVAAPRAAPVELDVEGEALGSGGYALVEHVGDVFLRSRFGDDRGALVVSAGDERREAELLRRRFATARDGELRALGSVVGSGGLAPLGALALLGEPPLGLAFHDACDDGDAPCFLPIASETADALPADEVAAVALRTPSIRAEVAPLLALAARCLEAPSCAPEPALARRARELEQAERTLDAPDGTAAYRPLARTAAGRLAIAFRHLEADHHANAVTALVESAGQRRRVPLERDAAKDLWRATTELPGASFRWTLEVLDERGQVRSATDPASPALADGRRRVDPAWLGALLPVARVSIDVREPSDCTLVGDTLWVAGDEGDHVHAIDAAGGQRLASIETGRRGLEALAWDPVEQLFLLGDEDAARIEWMDAEGASVATRELGSFHDGNGGLEGLTVRGTDGHVLAVKERSPSRIVELDPEGHELARHRVSFAPDLSAITWSPDDGAVYVLSDEAHTLYRLDDDLQVEASWELDLEHPEGVAFSRGRAYVVSDSLGELAVYALDAWRFGG